MATTPTVAWLRPHPSVFRSPKKLSFSPSPALYLPPPLHLASSSSLPAVTVRAFGRSDLDGFARRVASGQALRDAWRTANEGFEQLVFDARRAAERFDRRYSLSRRFDSAARAASARAREMDQELGIGRRWRSFSVDFSRNWPRYQKELNDAVRTPLGRAFGMIFLFWFVFSGWMFRFFILATWVLPFAAPLLIGKLANNLSPIEGSCPACKRRFTGLRNMVIRCAGCGNIVWQPKDDFRRGKNKSSEQDIIDIDIDEK